MISRKKTGYEFGIQYDFQEYFWEREWDKIVSKALDVSSENKKLVPLKKPVAEDEGEGSRCSDTEEYPENDKN